MNLILKVSSARFLWIESHELVHDRLHGWRSNNILPGVRPLAWSTAMVLCFVRGLDVLFQRIVQERLLREFSAKRFPKSTRMTITFEAWCPQVKDSITPLLGGRRQSLKKLLFDHLVEPHLTNTPAHVKNRRRWSAVFFGPPGTAKTTLVSEIANALSWPLITIETSDLLALGVDRMAHQAGLVFRKLQQLREVVIFVDEVEEFVRTRSDEDRESRLTTTAMLTLIQGLRRLEQSILIVATNHVDTFDQAVIRPGRFDLLVLIRPPSVESKIELWKEKFKEGYLTIAEKVFQSRAEIVERFTFQEWQIFLENCASNESQPISAESLEKYLDEAALGLTIDFAFLSIKASWAGCFVWRWANSELEVGQFRVSRSLLSFICI